MIAGSEYQQDKKLEDALDNPVVIEAPLPVTVGALAMDLTRRSAESRTR
jgi:hypothetical protein